MLEYWFVSIGVFFFIYLSTSTRSFQPHLPGGAPAWSVNGVPSWFICLFYQCSSGIPQYLTVGITSKEFLCILSLFRPTIAFFLFFPCACSLVGMVLSPWISTTFLSGEINRSGCLSFPPFYELGLDNHSNSRK